MNELTEITEIGTILKKKGLSSSQQVDALNAYCQRIYYSDQDSSFLGASNSYELALSSGYEKGRAIAEVYIGFYYWWNNNLKKCTVLLEDAIPILLKHRIYTEYGLAKLITILVLWAKGEMEEAFDVVHKALIEIESITTKNNMATARLSGALGVMYYDLNELDLSLTNYNRATIHSGSNTDFSFKAYINIGIAAIKKKQNKLSAAKSILEQAIEQSKVHGMWVLEARACYEIGTIFKLENNLERAAEFMEHSYRLREIHHAKPGMVSNLIALAEIEIIKKKNNVALEKLNTALKIATTENLKPKQTRILYLISNLYEEQGDLDSAFTFLKKHNTIAREVELEEKTNRLKNIQLKYNIEKAKKDAESQRKINLELKKANKLITKQKNELATSNHEKEILLKEIHHRVKNNMQIISSLMALQSLQVNDKKLGAELLTTRHRIQSMAMIHEMLYSTGEFSTIDYEQYLKQLINRLISSIKGAENNIEVRVEAKSIKLNMDTSIPLGLLINELVTNSLKYAFPNGDGIGFPADYDFENTSSLGLRLVMNLVVQLEGSLVRSNTKGTQYDITFKKIESIV